MTKLLNTGWEADRLYKSTVTVAFATPSRPISVTGYQFKLAMIPSDPQFISGGNSAQVLWFIEFTSLPLDVTDDWGVPVYKDNAKQNLHGGGVGNNILAVSILKASPWINSVNDVLIRGGLRLPVPASSTIQMFAGHAGAGPVDFECQGVITYE